MFPGRVLLIMAQRVQKYKWDGRQTPDLEKRGLFPKPTKNERYHHHELSAPVFAFILPCCLTMCIIVKGYRKRKMKDVSDLKRQRKVRFRLVSVTLCCV